MSTVEYDPPLQGRKGQFWYQYLIDSLLGCMGALLVTAIIYTFRLYPRIPNISIVYLLVVIGLASTRGSYAAILAALVAFFSFDFFIVPPLFTFVIYRIEEWIALFVFLVDAILTAQLASALRRRAREASRRERETHILYDLVRVTNREEEAGRQLQRVAQSIVDVFSSWGIRDCAILQPDAAGVLSVMASAYQPLEQVTLSSDERAMASWVMAHGRMMGLYDDASFAPSTPASVMQRVVVRSTWAGRPIQRSLRLIPLKAGQKVVGVLRLRVVDDLRRFPREERLEEENQPLDTRTAFFWTFLDQATSLIERVRLQRETLRIEVLQRTDALRAALLSSVSHDLRTPLTSIKASASSLLQDDVYWDEEARRGFAHSIEHEADRLNRLVGNLLDMSRIEEGALRPQKEWYSLSGLIHDVLGRLHPLLEERKVVLHLPDDLLLVEFDYVQIDQVLTNLLENAVRYTPAESLIEVSARSEGERVLISVADRGPGIPAGDLERVFDKFYRVLHSQRPGNYTFGSGLGLAVCKGVVEAHAGRIWAELRAGGGLVVNMALPVGAREGIML